MPSFDFGRIPDYLSILQDEFASFYLVGGTALSMIYLNHRLSYDIDLFVDPDEWDSIDPSAFENRLRCIKESYPATIEPIGEAENDDGVTTGKAFNIVEGDSEVKVDFIRDDSSLLNEIKTPELPQTNTTIRVASVEDLYRRKIKIAIGLTSYSIGGFFSGERHEARDLIDIYSLNQEHDTLSETLNKMVSNRDPQEVATKFDQYLDSFDERSMFTVMDETGFIQSDYADKPSEMLETVKNEVRQFRADRLDQSINTGNPDS